MAQIWKKSATRKNEKGKDYMNFNDIRINLIHKQIYRITKLIQTRKTKNYFLLGVTNGTRKLLTKKQLLNIHL